MRKIDLLLLKITLRSTNTGRRAKLRKNIKQMIGTAVVSTNLRTASARDRAHKQIVAAHLQAQADLILVAQVKAADRHQSV